MNYGPPHTFWCFAYERLNGFLIGINIESNMLLSKYMSQCFYTFTPGIPTNQKNIERQIKIGFAWKCLQAW